MMKHIQNTSATPKMPILNCPDCNCGVRLSIRRLPATRTKIYQWVCSGCWFKLHSKDELALSKLKSTLEHEELGARSMYRHITKEVGIVPQIGDEEWNISEWLKSHKVGTI